MATVDSKRVGRASMPRPPPQMKKCPLIRLAGIPAPTPLAIRIAGPKGESAAHLPIHTYF